MSDEIKQNELIKPPFDRKKFAEELRRHRASMKMGRSVMNEVRSEPRYELGVKSAESLLSRLSKAVMLSE